MHLDVLLQNLSEDTRVSLQLFLPELTLCATIGVLLATRLFKITAKLSSFVIATAGAAVAFWCAAPELWGGCIDDQEIFTGVLIYDSFTVYFRTLLTGFAVLFCIFTRISGIPDREDGADIYTLVMGATLGLCLMASANNLLTVFLAVEMASVPSYVLAGVLKGRRQSSEAALKYAVYGAGAAGVMLYGISLVAGVLGTVHLPSMAGELARVLSEVSSGETGASTLRVLALGGLMIMVGLAFKLSAVPFHFWCPDVFEGAPAEVNAFLSIASKAGALALLVRVAIGFGYLDPGDPPEPAAAAASASVETPLRLVSDEPAAVEAAEEAATAETGSADSAPANPIAPVQGFIVKLLALLAAITCTFGNLAAYGQTNIKRMLAYSTIAHAGYMMMPVAAAIAVAGTDPEVARRAIGSLAFYIALYLFMNLGAFAIIAFLRNAIRTETISDYAGLIRTCPTTTICFGMILFSLIGMPPLAGFAGKFAIFASLIEVGGSVMITLLVIAGLNTVISLVYYLRVLKVMTIDEPSDVSTTATIGFLPGAYAVAVTVPVLVFGILFNEPLKMAELAVKQLF